jgi:hypothetical protein
MNEQGTATGNSGNLMENEHVKELFGILQENGKDSSGLTALINHVGGMEDYLKQSELKLAEMKAQLDTMKEVQDHPIKTALQNTIKALEAKIAEMKAQISELKTNIVEGCKNAVSAFKEKGAAALNKLASFFKIKGGLQAIKNDAELSVKLNEKSIVKIGTFSQEYHKAGRAIKNMARVAIGKKPIDAVKESGKMAKAMSAPYKASIAINIAIGKQVDKMIASLDKLDKSVEAKRGDRAAKPKKPTLMERLDAKKKEIKERELVKPPIERAPKSKGLEV